MKSSNYIENRVLKGRKWKINLKLTWRNTINKLQWTGTYFKSSLYSKRRWGACHGFVHLKQNGEMLCKSCSHNESLLPWEDELDPFYIQQWLIVHYSAWPQEGAYMHSGMVEGMLLGPCISCSMFPRSRIFFNNVTFYFSLILSFFFNNCFPSPALQLWDSRYIFQKLTFESCGTSRPL